MGFDPRQRRADTAHEATIYTPGRGYFHAALRVVDGDGYEIGDPSLYEDVLLSYMKFAPRLPYDGPPVKFTVRQRFRIARHNMRCAVEQWIHDRLHNARCD